MTTTFPPGTHDAAHRGGTPRHGRRGPQARAAPTARPPSPGAGPRLGRIGRRAAVEPDDDRRRLARCAPAHDVGARRARPRPRLRGRRPRPRGRRLRPAPRCAMRWRPARARRGRPRRQGRRRAVPGRPRARRRSAGRCRRRRRRRASTAGATPPRRDARRRSPTTTTSATTSTACARSEPHLLLRPLARAPHSTLEEAQAAKYELVCRKLGLAARHAAARRRLRVGRHGHPRRRAARRQVVGITLSRSSSQLAASGSPTPASTDRIEIRLQDYRDIARRPVRRHQQHRHVRARRLSARTGEYFDDAARAAAPRRAAPEPRHLRPPGPAAASSRALVHRPLRVPRRRAARGRHAGLRDAERRLRGARRRVPARALRPHAAGLGGQPRGATGTRRCAWSARAGPASGGSTWRRPRSASSRAASRSTRCSASAATRRRPVDMLADSTGAARPSTLNVGPCRCSSCCATARSHVERARAA